MPGKAETVARSYRSRSYESPQDKGGKPLYQLVEDHLRQQIVCGELVPGDLIPSEPQLAEILDVSQGTVKKAINNLVSECMLYRHQGKGTYVSRIDFNNSLFRFFSYGTPEGEPIRIHKETTVRRIKSGRAEICRHLQIPARSKLLYIERIGYMKRAPILLEQCWWRAELVHGLEDEHVHIPDLMYAVVVEKFGVPVIRSEETLTADEADKRTAEVLRIRPGRAVVVLKRHTFTTNDRIIEFRITRGRADKFSYKTDIR